MFGSCTVSLVFVPIACFLSWVVDIDDNAVMTRE
jgi:hypothetical protein